MGDFYFRRTPLALQVTAPKLQSVQLNLLSTLLSAVSFLATPALLGSPNAVELLGDQEGFLAGSSTLSPKLSSVGGGGFSDGGGYGGPGLQVSPG